MPFSSASSSRACSEERKARRWISVPALWQQLQYHLLGVHLVTHWVQCSHLLSSLCEIMAKHLSLIKNKFLCFWHAYVCGGSCVFMFIDVHTHVCGDLSLVSRIILDQIALHFIHWGKVSQLNPQLIEKARLMGQPTLGIAVFAFCMLELQVGCHTHQPLLGC